MNKVSFDFDGCLELGEVQDFAEECKAIGCELWIVTSRLTGRKKGNDDLYAVADKLDIPRAQIVFTERKPKRDYFADNPGFDFHLDDDGAEVGEIADLSGPKAVWYFEDEPWRKSCLDAIDISDYCAT